MSQFKKIMLVSDGTPVAEAAESTAASIARHHNSEMLIVDVLRKPSFAERWLLKHASEMFASLEHEKEASLAKLVDKLKNQGVEKVESRLLHGRSSVEISHLVAEENCDLVVRYRKGRDSRQRGLFGATALNLLRVCPSPLLLVGEDQGFEEPHALACVDVHDEDQVNNSIMDAAETITHSSSPGFHVLYCWEMWGHEMLRPRMPEDAFKEMVAQTQIENEDLFNTFLRKHGLDEALSRTVIQYGQPYRVIPQYAREHDVNVVVMSTVSPTSPVNRLLGTTIESVIGELPCALLAVKPEGFEPSR